jgi:glycosyltransferase involved in cell wall biosynthesis
MGAGSRLTTLSELPAPPAGRTGWPWTEAPATPTRADCHSITVVTPSFNQGSYLEETIRSVLLQGYPRLQYIVLDGGSTDESVAILDRYAPWISYWRSGPDDGQAAAVAQALTLGSGEIFNWINSDDVLAPGALAVVDGSMDEADVVAGVCVNVAPDGAREDVQTTNLSAAGLMKGDSGAVFHQPAVWIRRDHLIAAGGIDRSLHYVFDWEMLVRVLAHGARVVYTDTTLAYFRLHPESKTVKSIAAFEFERRRAARLLAQRLAPGELRATAAALGRRQRWWRVLATLQRRYGNSPRTAAIILQAALREPGVRLSRLTFGSMRRALSHPRG